MTIREQDPLKQGLKLRDRCSKEIIRCIREQDPLKQGLKHYPVVVRISDIHIIREQDPLKQGLKLIVSCIFTPSRSIREQDPLKQGLKQENGFVIMLLRIKFESKIH